MEQPIEESAITVSTTDDLSQQDDQVDCHCSLASRLRLQQALKPPGASHEVEESAIAVCHDQHDKHPSQQASKVDCHCSLASQQVAHGCLSSPTSSTAITVSPASLRPRRMPKTTTSPSQDQHGEGYAFSPAVASASAQRPTAARPHAQGRFCSAMKQQQLFSTGEPKTDCWKNS
jgi:hypothetical protein